MNTSRKIIHIEIIAIFVALVILIFPNVTLANYTLNGHSFETYAEMQNYLSEYMRVWRELHGISDDISTNATKELKTTTQQTYTSSVQSVNTASTKLDIETKSVRDIDYDSATLIGSIDFKKSKLVRIWFDYGISPYALLSRTDTEILKAGDKWTKFDAKAVNLTPETRYYYRAGGVNENGVITYGLVQKFTSGIDTTGDNALIKVSTRYAQDIDSNRVTFSASINFRKATYAYMWFEYSDESDNLYEDTNKKLVYKTEGTSFSEVVRGLEPNTTYYYRAVVQDSNNIRNYGTIMRVVTPQDIVDEKPKITIGTIKNITTSGATITGTVDMNDFRNGKVFCIFGEDAVKINEVATKYDTFSSIREFGDDRQKMLLDSDLDRDKVYTFEISNLDKYIPYSYAIGVEYENEDDDNVLFMSRTSSFMTKSK